MGRKPKVVEEVPEPKVRMSKKINPKSVLLRAAIKKVKAMGLSELMRFVGSTDVNPSRFEKIVNKSEMINFRFEVFALTGPYSQEVDNKYKFMDINIVSYPSNVSLLKITVTEYDPNKEIVCEEFYSYQLNEIDYNGMVENVGGPKGHLKDLFKIHHTMYYSDDIPHKIGVVADLLERKPK